MSGAVLSVTVATLMLNLLELIRIFLWFLPDTVSGHGLPLCVFLSFFSFSALFCFLFFGPCVRLVWIQKQIRSN